MTNMDVHYSKSSDEWETPQGFYDRLDMEFGFTLDPCATPENAKCERYFTIEDDGLARSWGRERVFMNPPYGRAIGDWMRKALTESERGATVVCLVPARTETKWWHETVMKAHELALVRGRLRFGGSKVNAPFPNAVVVFYPRLALYRSDRLPRLSAIDATT